MTDLVAPDDPRALIDIAVRPEADAFPMLSGEAFVDLAIGIREHGQVEPIELDTDGAIGDGRNRYAACRWLGIEPHTVTLPAETDWFARVIEKNLNRRHATAGARAIALIKLIGNSVSSREVGAIAGLSHTWVLRARFLVDHADDLVPQVEAGASLRAAYDLAVQREREHADADVAAVDDEARRISRIESLERERAELIDAVRKEHEAIGDPVVLPAEPSLALRIETTSDIERIMTPPTELDVDALKAQQRLHKQMQRAKLDLATIRDMPIDPAAPMFEGLVMAMRSWVSQVVAIAYDIAERHNAALDNDAQLRRVK